MDVSESTFKRLLNNEDITLSKLIDLCQCLELNLFDVMEQCSRQNTSFYHFTEDQEKLLAKDFTHFKVFRLLVMSRDVKAIQEELMVSPKDLQVILRNLEKVKLIERWENNRIKLLGKFPFKWSKQGPLEKTYVSWIKDMFVYRLDQTGINGVHEKTKTKSMISELMLDEQSQAEFQKEMTELYERYRSISKIHLSSKNKSSKPFSFLYLAGTFSWWDHGEG